MKSVNMVILIVAIIAIIAIAYLALNAQKAKTTTSTISNSLNVSKSQNVTNVKNNSIAMVGNFNSSVLGIKFYKMGASQIVCMQGQGASPYCYLPNYNNYTPKDSIQPITYPGPLYVNYNFSDLDEIYNTTTNKSSVHVSAPQKFAFKYLNYSSGKLSLAIIALTNITNTSIFIQDVKSNKIAAVLSLSAPISIGQTYVISLGANSTMLRNNVSQLCVDQDCQILGCVKFNVNKSSDMNATPSALALTATFSDIEILGPYCDPPYTLPWLNSLEWMRQNIPSNTSILSWWDYGDWIDWYADGNSVLSLNNLSTKKIYQSAAQFALSPNENVTPATLANMMRQNNAKYLVLDSDLIQKWDAVSFLACIDINQTSVVDAEASGSASGAAFSIGASKCEQAHDPALALVPEDPQNATFCSYGTGNTTYQIGFIIGTNFSEQTYCLPTTFWANNKTATPILSSNGSKTNMELEQDYDYFFGYDNLYGNYYAVYLVLQLPSGTNNTVTNSITEFYNSNYYNAFILGNLPGFQNVYPNSANDSDQVRGVTEVKLFKLLNSTS